jgi:hypothetical protein
MVTAFRTFNWGRCRRKLALFLGPDGKDPGANRLSPRTANANNYMLIEVPETAAQICLEIGRSASRKPLSV